MPRWTVPVVAVLVLAPAVAVLVALVALVVLVALVALVAPKNDQSQFDGTSANQGPRSLRKGHRN